MGVHSKIFKMNNPGAGFGNLAWNDEGQISSLDLYSPIIRDLSLKAGRTICINPVSHASSAGPFTFSLPSIPQYYVHLPSLRLFVEGKVTKLDGGDIPGDISVCDNLVASLFESCLFEINGKKVPELSSEYLQYKHYIGKIFKINYFTQSIVFCLNFFQKHACPMERKLPKSTYVRGLKHRMSQGNMTLLLTTK